jgi:16S rRNA (guanine527-N7)-methyltransferase
MIEQLSAAVGRDVSRETFEKLERFAAFLITENDRQNLVAPNSIPDLWTRHILDGAQLLGLASGRGSWCDIGSGAGLPGLVIAILGGTPMTLIEPRRLRADFLRQAIDHLDLGDVTVSAKRVERVEGKFDFITARAVARLDKLFGIAWHLAHGETKWVLPKGESAQSELDDALGSWQGEFCLVPSRTHPAAAIIVATHVRRRGKQ